MGAASAGAIESPEARSETRREDRAARSKFSWKLLLLAVAVGSVLEMAGPEWVRRFFEAVRFSGAAGISSVLAALMAAVVLHEAGHLLTALLLDFKVIGGCFGPVRVSRRGERWAWRFSAKSLFMASVSAIPRSCRGWRWRMLAVVVAGPLATLLTGLAAGCALLLRSQLGWTTNFLAALAQLSFFIFLLGLIPNRTNAPIRNDARLFCVIWRNSTDAAAIRAWHHTLQA